MSPEPFVCPALARASGTEPPADPESSAAGQTGGSPARGSAGKLVIDPYHPSFTADVLLTGDVVRSSDILPGDPTEDCPVFADDATGTGDLGQAQASTDAELGEGRLGFGRFRLANNFIRVRILGEDSKPSMGRMTNASVTGLFVRCQSPLPFRSAVRVEWIIASDMTMSFSGKVIRTTPEGMAIHLSTDDANWRFRASFIDLCRKPSDQPPTVSIRKMTAKEVRQHEADDAILRELGRHWRSVEEALDDDGTHQQFIQRCLEKRRLQFALERYRELQLWPVSDFDATPYLSQIGKILLFYQAGRATPKNDDGLSDGGRYVRLAVVAILLTSALVSVALFMGHSATPPPSAAPSPRTDARALP